MKKIHWLMTFEKWMKKNVCISHSEYCGRLIFKLGNLKWYFFLLNQWCISFLLHFTVSKVTIRHQATRDSNLAASETPRVDKWVFDKDRHRKGKWHAAYMQTTPGFEIIIAEQSTIKINTRLTPDPTAFQRQRGAEKRIDRSSKPF